MPALTEEELLHLAELCRIETTAEERADLADKLQRIVAHVEMLSEVEVGRDVPPCYHIAGGEAGSLAPDEVGELLNREAFLANAPAEIAGMVRIPLVLRPAP